jgi:hypothetical protein
MITSPAFGSRIRKPHLQAASASRIRKPHPQADPRAASASPIRKPHLQAPFLQADTRAAPVSRIRKPHRLAASARHNQIDTQVKGATKKKSSPITEAGAR